MAKAVINLQKESGGIVKITPVDGVGITEVTVPESGELVTKDYADLKVALESFIGANQSLSEKGYQKLPGGLIIQWGWVAGAASEGTINFPVSFPYYRRVFMQSDGSASSANNEIITNDGSNPLLSSFNYLKTGALVRFQWFAIGY